MKMEVSKKDAALLLGLLGVLVLVAVYNFLFVSYSDKTNALKNENSKLKMKVQVLQNLANQREDLLNSTKEYQDETREILEHFPADVREEDIIMLAVKMQNEAPYENITAVQIGNAVDVYSVADIEERTDEAVSSYLGEAAPVESAETADTEEAEEVAEPVETMPGEISLDGNYTLMARSADIVGVSTYEGFKEAIRMITNRKDRTQLSVMASYDIESGLVDSSISLITNYMYGTGKRYETPNIPFISQGTNNIFGTVDLRGGNNANAENTEESAEAEETEETEQ